jgi:hypothetical protein
MQSLLKLMSVASNIHCFIEHAIIKSHIEDGQEKTYISRHRKPPGFRGLISSRKNNFFPLADVQTRPAVSPNLLFMLHPEFFRQRKTAVGECDYSSSSFAEPNYSFME